MKKPRTGWSNSLVLVSFLVHQGQLPGTHFTAVFYNTMSFLSLKERAFSEATVKQVNKGISVDGNMRAGKERSMVIKYVDKHKSGKSKFENRMWLESFFSGIG